MTDALAEDRFRMAAEAEGGVPISAGARVAHLRKAVDAGRAFYVDLSSVPEDDREAVVAEIKAVVDRAYARALAAKPGSARPATKTTN
jgi:hypothetical protein